MPLNPPRKQTHIFTSHYSMKLICKKNKTNIF